jgi:hypothetical protein
MLVTLTGSGTKVWPLEADSTKTVYRQYAAAADKPLKRLMFTGCAAIDRPAGPSASEPAIAKTGHRSYNPAVAFTFPGLAPRLLVGLFCAGCSGGAAVEPSEPLVKESDDAGRTAKARSDAGQSAPGEPSPALDDDAPRPDVPAEPTPDQPEPEVLLDDDAPPCMREVTFEAVPLKTPPPFDVVIVADHSDSLSWSRDDLASGLESLLDQVRGHDARFYVLTPTQYGPSSSGAINWVTGEDLVQWKDPATGVAYSHAVTDYTISCTDPNGIPIACPPYPSRDVQFILEGTWTLRTTTPAAKISALMTDAEFAAEADALGDSILDLAGAGSSYEQPMCTLHRYLAQ